VHPQFPVKPYLYLLYTYDPPETAQGTGDGGPDGGGARVSRLVRVEADPATDYATAKPGTQLVLLGRDSVFANIGNPATRNDYERPSCGTHGAYVRDCLAADEASHTIGTVAFGPDGALYVGNGDGCDFMRVQPVCTRALDLDSLSGKILRIDPDTGAGMRDNPYATDDPEENRSKVYQLGLRNPFRFSFDKPTGQLFVGDVGWGAWEEVNRAGPGANFGWPCYEGGNGNSVEQPGYSDLPRCMELRTSGAVITPSLFGYHHNGMGSSVLVGDVYRGTSYPPLYRGTLFYTDYNLKEIRFLAFDGRGQVASSQLVVGPVGFLSQISADPVSGDLFVMRIASEGPVSVSTLARLVFRGYGPGPAPGPYTITSSVAGACVEARVLEGDSVPTELGTRPCADAPEQRFELENVGSDLYVVRADGALRLWTGTQTSPSSGSLRIDKAARSASQRFRIYPLGGGFQLIGEESELCVATPGGDGTGALELQRCDDVPAQIFRLTSTINRPPELSAQDSKVSTLGQSVQVQLSAGDPDGQALTWFASGLPDGISIDPQSGILMGELMRPGVFQVLLRVSDGQLETTSRFVWTVIDNLLPDVVIDQPLDGRRYLPGEVVQFAGHATDHRGQELPPYRLEWELLAHHNEHVHFGTLPNNVGPEGALLIEDHGDNNSLELCLSATDVDGRVGRTCRLLLPLEVEYTIDSLPSGLTLIWEGVARETPFTVQTHVGGVRDLSAPGQQMLQQTRYGFVGWSDGGAAMRQVAIGSEPRSLIATYAVAP